MRNLYDILNESLLDDNIEDRYTSDKVANVVTWRNLSSDRETHISEIDKIHQYVTTCGCKQITLVKRRSQKPIDINPHKHYIYFALKNMSVRVWGIAYGDEKLYTWDIPVASAGHKNAHPTRFFSLVPSKITRDLSPEYKLELYEMPKELEWLYDKMKKSVKSTNESLLDDEETLSKNSDNEVYNSMLGRMSSAWIVRDSKWITYKPTGEFERIVNGRPFIFLGACANMVGGQYAFNTWDYEKLKDIKTHKLKFQPLEFCQVNSGVSHVDKWLAELSCDSMGMLKMYLNPNCDSVDPNSFNGDINHIISIYPYEFGSSNSPVVKAYRKHLGIVNFSNTPSQDNKCVDIKDWDCDYLFVPEYGLLSDSSQTIRMGEMYGLDMNKVQTIVSNNPKAKEIYINRKENTFKILCKGSGANRKVIRIAKKTDGVIDKIFNKYHWLCIKDVENWK